MKTLKKLWKGQLEAGLRGVFFISLGVEYCVAQGTMLLVPGSLELLIKPHVTSIHVYVYKLGEERQSGANFLV